MAWDRGAHDEGAHGAGAVDDEDQGHRAAGAQVLGLDRRLDPVVTVDLPADVDLEAGVRRERADDRPPQVLLIRQVLCGKLLPQAPPGIDAWWSRSAQPAASHGVARSR